jgi:16S rRNA (guanine527-N7)-methyltransferase
VQQLADGARRLNIPLTNDQLVAFQIYYETLIAWNKRVNLTRITGYEAIQVKHFLDSLSCLPIIRATETELGLAAGAGSKAIDVGAGAGFPGVALKIALPSLRLTLLEATGKKAEFLRFLAERLELPDVAVVTARAEQAGHDPAHREQYDIVLARALAKMPTLAELTLPLAQVGGKVIAHKGEDPTAEVAAAQMAIATLGGEVEDILSVAVPGLEGARHLVVLKKLGPTPAAHPRRPGMPAKRPLI